MPRTIFSIENQMQVIPRRETWENKQKTNEILIFFFHFFSFPFIFSHFFYFLLFFSFLSISFYCFSFVFMAFYFSHLFSCPFICSHGVSFPFICSHVFSFCVFCFSLEKNITKLDLLQFDTLFSFADKWQVCNAWWYQKRISQLKDSQGSWSRKMFFG